MEATLTSERIRLDVSKVKVQEVSNLKDVDAKDGIVLAHQGSFGLAIVDSSDQVGSASFKLQKCIITLVYVREKGYVFIYTRKDNGIDLRKHGIVSAVRSAEARLRNLDISGVDLNVTGDIPGMSWYALGNDKVVSLLSGSDKANVSKEHLTKLALTELIEIIMHTLLD